ncbi:hypothetical protein JDY09_02435 [Thermoleophilum album]|uniref:hypothetical protein n=1 Tax=Thermoleophilum album TaxID=29539 RepID=UPI00237C6325|nr:hypothetical protein [Thermoleophilum album]WDT94130.1 hypothetical protein JDY09_02435 [Thermoleophilum album]
MSAGPGAQPAASGQPDVLRASSSTEAAGTQESRHALGGSQSLLLAVGAFAAGYLAIAALRPPSRAGGVVAVGAMAALLAVCLFALGALRLGLRVVALSPLTFVALAQLFIFGIRPAAVALWPGDGAFPLVWLGFRFADLGRVAAAGALGMSLLGLAFALVWETRARKHGLQRTPGLAEQPALPTSEEFDDRRLRFVLTRAAAAGTVLWLILFFRNGGIDALLNDPSRLHLNQFGGGHYVFGYALCLAAALVALVAFLERPSRQRLLLLTGLAAVALAASVALQTRGQLLATAAAGLTLLLALRSPTRRQALALAALATILLAAFAWMRTVRELSHTVPFAQAARLAITDRPLLTATRDFVEFDHLVALTAVVPREHPHLHGRSLAEAPLAFLPRRLYPDKPLPLDFELSTALLGASGKAGTPFTIVGEMYWNFGWIGGLVALAAFGAVAGAGWWRLVRSSGRKRLLVGTLVLGYSYLLLTRPLGAMAMTAAIGLVALLVVVLLAERLPVPSGEKIDQ